MADKVLRHESITASRQLVVGSSPGTRAYYNAFLGQYVTNIHLATTVVASGLTPEGGCMRGPRLADSSNDALSPGEQLAHELKANASARAYNQPGGEVLVGIQDIGYLVHRPVAGDRVAEGC